MNWDSYKNKFDFKTQREEYRKEESRIHNDFRRDALTEVGMLGHPKADKVYALAWENGHAYGFREVFSHLQDLAEIFKDDPRPPKVKVELIESERGWGQKVDEIKEFDTLEQANAFITEFNSKNDKAVVPDWYMYARLQGGRQ